MSGVLGPACRRSRWPSTDRATGSGHTHWARCRARLVRRILHEPSDPAARRHRPDGRLGRRLGLVAPPDRLGWGGPESAAAASLPQPGKRGKAVRALQKRLVDAGYLRAQYRTGSYGSRTKKAVKALQRRYNLWVMAGH